MATQEEYDARIQRRRENHLKKIQSELNSVLREVSPENANDYKIEYRPITRHNSYLGGRTDVTPSQSPAYGMFLVSASDKRKKYEFMHLFRQDIDKSVKNEDIRLHHQLPAFGENIEKGIKHLQEEARKGQKKKGRGGIEGTLGVIAIIGLIGGLLFLSPNLLGNVIENPANSASNWIGGFLFALGLIGVFVYFKGR